MSHLCGQFSIHKCEPKNGQSTSSSSDYADRILSKILIQYSMLFTIRFLRCLHTLNFYRILKLQHTDPHLSYISEV